MNYSPNYPGYDAYEITPADSDLPRLCKMLYVGSAGNIRATTAAGTVVNFTNVLAGSYVYLQVRRVHSTGTTATGIVGLI